MQPHNARPRQTLATRSQTRRSQRQAKRLKASEAPATQHQAHVPLGGQNPHHQIATITPNVTPKSDNPNTPPLNMQPRNAPLRQTRSTRSLIRRKQRQARLLKASEAQATQHQAHVPLGGANTHHQIATTTPNVTSKSSPIKPQLLGLHVFAILGPDSKESGLPNTDMYIISIHVDGKPHTYGPSIHQEEKAHIVKLLSDRNVSIYGSPEVLWHALDLMRILPNLHITSVFPVKLKVQDFAHRMPVHSFHEDTDTNRAISMQIALTSLQRRRRSTEHKLLAPINFICRYSLNLPTFRLKWLENQGAIDEELIPGWAIDTSHPATHEDRKLLGPHTTRYKLTQSPNGWSTHIMFKTIVKIHDPDDTIHNATVRDVDGLHVVFILAQPCKIDRIFINHSEESLHAITQHFKYVSKLLTGEPPHSGALQFVAPQLSLPRWSTQQWQQEAKREQSIANEYPTPDCDYNDPKDIRRVQRELDKYWRLVKHQTIL